MNELTKQTYGLYVFNKMCKGTPLEIYKEIISKY